MYLIKFRLALNPFDFTDHSLPGRQEHGHKKLFCQIPHPFSIESRISLIKIKKSSFYPRARLDFQIAGLLVNSTFDHTVKKTDHKQFGKIYIIGKNICRYSMWFVSFHQDICSFMSP